MSRAVVTRKPLAKQPRMQSKRWRQMTVTLMMAKAKWSELRVLQTLIEEARSDTRNYYKQGGDDDKDGVDTKRCVIEKGL